MPRAPSFTPRSRNARVGPMVLPAEGRKGRTPKWPLGETEPGELTVWADLWHTPQAVAWEAMGSAGVRVVARYVRYLLAAEKLDKAAMPECRQLEDRLGLTPKAMRLMLWTIETTETGEAKVVAVSNDRWRNAAAG